MIKTELLPSLVGTCGWRGGLFGVEQRSRACKGVAKWHSFGKKILKSIERNLQKTPKYSRKT